MRPTEQELAAESAGGAAVVYGDMGFASPPQADRHPATRADAGRPLQFPYPAIKRVLDFLGALVLMVMLAPVMIGLVLVIRSEGAPAIFRHRRIGYRGRAFYCYKFRTMVPNSQVVLEELLRSSEAAREEWAKDHKLRDDPRITRIGQFLRKTSLDELPQLFNVLRGEMSLVGPRPIVQDEVAKYGRGARQYWSVKPGMTGLWQVTGRNDTTYARRVAMDRYYAANRSLLMDIVILLRTVMVVANRDGAY